MEPLKKVQVEGHLMFAEPQDLFGNLDELCYVRLFSCSVALEIGPCANALHSAVLIKHSVIGVVCTVVAISVSPTQAFVAVEKKVDAYL